MLTMRCLSGLLLEVLQVAIGRLDMGDEPRRGIERPHKTLHDSSDVANESKKRMSPRKANVPAVADISLPVADKASKDSRSFAHLFGAVQHPSDLRWFFSRWYNSRLCAEVARQSSKTVYARSYFFSSYSFLCRHFICNLSSRETLGHSSALTRHHLVISRAQFLETILSSC